MTAANVIGLLVLGASGFVAALLALACLKDALWRKAGRHLLFYIIDATAAMTGFVLAFGLTVHSWFWLISVLIVSRWSIHTLHSAWYAKDAQEKATGE